MLESRTAGVDAERAQQIELGEGGELEAAAQGVEPGQQRRLGVALHGVVDGDAGQRAADVLVGPPGGVEVEHQEGRGVVIDHEAVPSPAQLVGRDGQGEKARASPQVAARAARAGPAPRAIAAPATAPLVGGGLGGHVATEPVAEPGVHGHERTAAACECVSGGTLVLPTYVDYGPAAAAAARRPGWPGRRTPTSAHSRPTRTPARTLPRAAVQE